MADSVGTKEGATDSGACTTGSTEAGRPAANSCDGTVENAFGAASDCETSVEAKLEGTEGAVDAKLKEEELLGSEELEPALPNVPNVEGTENDEKEEDAAGNADMAEVKAGEAEGKTELETTAEEKEEEGEENDEEKADEKELEANAGGAKAKGMTHYKAKFQLKMHTRGYRLLRRKCRLLRLICFL